MSTIQNNLNMKSIYIMGKTKTLPILQKLARCGILKYCLITNWRSSLRTPWRPGPWRSRPWVPMNTCWRPPPRPCSPAAPRTAWPRRRACAGLWPCRRPCGAGIFADTYSYKLTIGRHDVRKEKEFQSEEKLLAEFDRVFNLEYRRVMNVKKRKLVQIIDNLPG